MNLNLTLSATARMGMAAFAGMLVMVGFSGCKTASVLEKTPSLGWEDHRFSNQPRPYDTLLVEIDAVEGTQPTAYEMAELEAFLRRATNKPGGIRIKLDNIIPRDVARNRAPGAMALEFLNGPDDDRTAFLYIFCYRSRLGGLLVKPDNPNFTYFPHPCSVFIDRSYIPFLGLFYGAQMRRAILLHETGHALGLAKNSAHSEKGHCSNPKCLMWPKIVFEGRRFFTFKQPWRNTTFCAECEHDLETYKTSERKPNERLWKGFFVHEKPGYQFFALPGFVYVHVGNAADVTEDQVAESRRAAVDGMKGGTSFIATTNTFDPAENAAALALLAAEDNDSIQSLALKIFERCAVIAEELLKTEPEKVTELLSEALISAAKTFPDIQAKLRNLREKAPVPVASGSG